MKSIRHLISVAVLVSMCMLIPACSGGGGGSSSGDNNNGGSISDDIDNDDNGSDATDDGGSSTDDTDGSGDESTATGVWTMNFDDPPFLLDSSMTCVLFERNGQVSGMLGSDATLSGQVSETLGSGGTRKEPAANSQFNLTVVKLFGAYRYTLALTRNGNSMTGTVTYQGDSTTSSLQATLQESSASMGITGNWVFRDWEGQPMFVSLCQEQDSNLVYGVAFGGEAANGYDDGTIGIDIETVPELGFTATLHDGKLIDAEKARKDNFQRKNTTIVRIAAGSSGEDESRVSELQTCNGAGSLDEKRVYAGTWWLESYTETALFGEGKTATIGKSEEVPITITLYTDGTMRISSHTSFTPHVEWFQDGTFDDTWLTRYKINEITGNYSEDGLLGYCKNDAFVAQGGSFDDQELTMTDSYDITTPYIWDDGFQGPARQVAVYRAHAVLQE